PDPAHEGVMSVGLELDGPFVDERVHVVEVPVAVTLDPQPVTETFVFPAQLKEVDGPRVDGLPDLQLHRELGDRPGVAIRLHLLLDLCFEVGDLLLVVVHLTDEFTSASSSSWRPRRRSGWR